MNLLDITYYIIYILNLNRLDFNKNQYFFICIVYYLFICLQLLIPWKNFQTLRNIFIMFITLLSIIFLYHHSKYIIIDIK